MMNTGAISAFEYVTILISIILGLGITQVLSSKLKSIMFPSAVSVAVVVTITLLVYLVCRVYPVSVFPLGLIACVMPWKN